jgi:hypothetical protein
MKTLDFFRFQVYAHEKVHRDREGLKMKYHPRQLSEIECVIKQV